MFPLPPSDCPEPGKRRREAMREATEFLTIDLRMPVGPDDWPKFSQNPDHHRDAPLPPPDGMLTFARPV